jgi:hypothetical protein
MAHEDYRQFAENAMVINGGSFRRIAQYKGLRVDF